MTRKEEIKQAGLYYANNLDDIKPNDEFSKNLCIALGQAYIKGAEWADRTMLDKVCEWLKSYRQDTYDGTGYIAGIVNDKTIEDLRNAMEKE